MNLFPQKNDFFRIELKGNDNSYKEDILFCLAQDNDLVVCDRKYSGHCLPTEKSFLLRRDECNFYPVSEEILSAFGFKPAAQKSENPLLNVDQKMLRTLISLCHPDRHNNSTAANKATKYLLSLRR